MTSTLSTCPRCRRVLRELPPAARYCSACGMELPGAAADAPNMSKPTLRERMEQIQALLHGHMAEDASLASIEQLHSLMLMGYANAMLQLGWRYEHGSGVARNPSEAERCYIKSAKLGNVFARGRLGDRVEISEEGAVEVEKISANET